MPKVTFVNEHRTIEVEKGRLLSEVASDVGIEVCRAHFAGIGFGDYSVWIRGEDAAVSPAGFFERFFGGAKGWRRQANRTRVLGDVEVWTAAIGGRLRTPRPIASPPRPSSDKDARRMAADASGTAAFPYGNPLAIGKGERTPVARSTGKAKAAGAKDDPDTDADDASDESDES